MKKLILFLTLVIFISISVLADYPQSEQNSARYYDNAKVIKVKYSQGDTYVIRSYDEGREEAGVNIPLFDKDIAGTNDGRLDIYLGRSNFMRLDFDTEVEFLKIPQLRKTDLKVFVKRGGIYLDLYNLDYEKDVEIQTPDCGVFILNKGVYRINYNGSRGTEVFVYEGLAEVAGTERSRNVMGNQKLVMRDGAVLERPFFFYSSEKDNFDLWNEKRHNLVNYARSSSSRYLDRGYEDYEYELSRSGRWRYNSTYGSNIWIPYNVGSNWRPYYNGRWIWTPHYGYYWYSYDPWNSFTYHYGRWQYDSFWGWYWLPGYRWSPAWVGWSYSGSYYGWTPLSRYNRPVIVINKRWLRNYKYSNGIPWRSQSSVFIKKGNLGRSIKKVALRQGSFVNMNSKGLTYKGVSPVSKYNYKNVKVLNSRGRTVKFKEGGISSRYYNPSKYKSNGTKKNGVSYKYKKSNSSSVNTRKYSGFKSSGSKKISVKGFSSSRKSSTGIKKTSSSSTGTKIRKKKKSGYPSFSTKRYSGSGYSGNTNYSSRSSRGYSIASRYGKGTSGLSKYSNRKYYPSRGNAVSYKKKNYVSGNSYNYSRPKFNSKNSSSYKSYRSYTPKTYTYKRKSYNSGNSYKSYRSYIPRSSSYSKKSYNSFPKYSRSYKNYSGNSRSFKRSGSSRSYSKSSSSRNYSRSSGSRSSSSRSYSRSSSSRSYSRSSSSSSGSSSKSVRKK